MKKPDPKIYVLNFHHLYGILEKQNHKDRDKMGDCSMAIKLFCVIL